MPTVGPNVPYSNGPAAEQIVKIRETLLMMASLADRNLGEAKRAGRSRTLYRRTPAPP